MIEINCQECDNKIKVENRRTKMCSDCSREKKLKRCRDYKQKNKDKVSIYNKSYKAEKSSYISAYNKTYNVENRDKIQKRQTEQHRERRKTDLKYKMSIVLRNRFRKFYKGFNPNGMVGTIGCSYENFIKWIEFNFTYDMSWKNHGKYWHIDHVLLCHLFDHTNEDDVKICFNWKNTRPLLSEKNLSRKTIDNKDLLNHEIKLAYFEKLNRDGYNHIDMNFAYLTTKLLEKSSSGSS